MEGIFKGAADRLNVTGCMLTFTVIVFRSAVNASLAHCADCNKEQSFYLLPFNMLMFWQH